MFKEFPEKARPAENPTEIALNEDIFRRIVEASPTAIVLINKEGIIVLVNAQTEKLFGYSRDELQGRHVEIIIPSRFRIKHSKYRNEYFEKPSNRPMGAGRDLFGLHKSGKEIPVEIGLSPLTSGEEIFTLGSIIDITERKRAEQLFKHVVEASPNAIILIDQQGRINLVNRQMENLFGYSKSEIAGKPLEILLPERYKIVLSSVRESYLLNPTFYSAGSEEELFLVRKDATEIPVEVGLTPIESENGILILGSIIDISGRKEAAAKKEQEAALAEQHARELIRLAELERFQKLTIGRELKMIELKSEIQELKKKLEEK